jgi:hypothetical protein
VYLWCQRTLAAVPTKELLSSTAMSNVVAVELDDGRSVVIKRRPDEEGRAKRCVSVQSSLAMAGFPCPRPLTDVTITDGMAIHAEEWLPGGTLVQGDDQDAARSSALLFADLMARMERINAHAPLPNPEWVRWDHTDVGVFPANESHDARAALIPVPAWIVEAAQRVRARMRSVELPRVVGHADWEAQNLRWKRNEPHAVHDWDSLAYMSEAALVGAAAGVFATGKVPFLAPLDSSVAFLDAYEESRRRAFTSEETNVAWAASLWTSLHNARGEVLYEQPPVALASLEPQVEARLALARV